MIVFIKAKSGNRQKYTIEIAPTRTTTTKNTAKQYRRKNRTVENKNNGTAN